jgi:hypothetical protein
MHPVKHDTFVRMQGYWNGLYIPDDHPDRRRADEKIAEHEKEFS